MESAAELDPKWSMATKRLSLQSRVLMGGKIIFMGQTVLSAVVTVNE
jgi:hypothetical protein